MRAENYDTVNIRGVMDPDAIDMALVMHHCDHLIPTHRKLLHSWWRHNENYHTVYYDTTKITTQWITTQRKLLHSPANENYCTVDLQGVEAIDMAFVVHQHDHLVPTEYQ